MSKCVLWPSIALCTMHAPNTLSIWANTNDAMISFTITTTMLLVHFLAISVNIVITTFQCVWGWVLETNDNACSYGHFHCIFFIFTKRSNSIEPNAFEQNRRSVCRTIIVVIIFWLFNSLLWYMYVVYLACSIFFIGIG